MRTSPTNIGLWMLSALGAHDFGYLTVDQVVDKLTHTMKTIGKLERYEGHLLNWYDIETLTPLEPRYVSTVDSGNLLGALWSLEHGLEELIERPVLDGRAFEGLRDAGEILKQAVEQRRHSRGFEMPAPFDELLRARESPPERIADALHLLRRTEGSAAALGNEVRSPPRGRCGGGLLGHCRWRGRYRPGWRLPIATSPGSKSSMRRPKRRSPGWARMPCVPCARISTARLRFSTSPTGASVAFRGAPGDRVGRHSSGIRPPLRMALTA